MHAHCKRIPEMAVTLTWRGSGRKHSALCGKWAGVGVQQPPAGQPCTNYPFSTHILSTGYIQGVRKIPPKDGTHASEQALVN